MEISIVKPSFQILTPVKQIKTFPYLIEQAGRTCYKSEEKITKVSHKRFIRMLIKSGHESVLEHCVITARLIGDRSMSHQLVRHRIAAYSQELQRYCDYSKKGFQVICPPKISNSNPEFDTWKKCIAMCYVEYLALLAAKIPPEDARSVLPNATKTEVVTTFNLRQWRHVFRERALNKRAQWQIKVIMLDGLIQFRKLLPVVFEDLG